MLALGLDTSTPRVSVALVGDERTAPVMLAGREEQVVNAHAEVLTRLVDTVLSHIGVTAADLDVIGVGLGPGPFTGLRVGIVTALAIADAVGIPAFGMCSLDAVAAGYPDGGPFAVLTDARRRQVYWATYTDRATRDDGPDINTPAEVADALRGRVHDITGSAALAHADTFDGFRLTEPRWPSAEVIAADGWARLRNDETPAPLTPMYLRRPDARVPGAPKRVTPS